MGRAPRASSRTGALVLGSGLAANAGVLARRPRRRGRNRRARGRSVGLGIRRAGVGASGRRGLRIRRDRRLPRSRFPVPARGLVSISRRRSPIRCAISSRATAQPVG